MLRVGGTAGCSGNTTLSMDDRTTANRRHDAPIYTLGERAIALGYGAVCHTSFALGIGAMIASMYTGLTFGLGPFDGPLAVVADTVLVLQFVLLHSFLLSERGRAVLVGLAPVRLGEPLQTTTYAIIASWQLLLTFIAWSPIGALWWQPEGGVLAMLSVAYGASWLLLLASMADAGLPVQTGFLGWSAVARGRTPGYPPFVVRGTFRYVRQPIYIAFTLTMWTAPVWTPDRLLLAVGWTAYCLFGPRLKEARYLGFHGERYQRYRQLVPYWLPRLHPIDPVLATGGFDATTTRASDSGAL